MENLVAFRFKEIYKVIPLAEARARHIDYLLNGPFVVKGKSVVHSLVINKTDLKILYDNANSDAKGEGGGARLYFCKETDATGTSFLNIIAVPFDYTGENVLTAGGASTIVNTLEPCPDKCPQNADYRLSHSTNDLNYKKSAAGKDIWCKPNLETPLDSRKWFDDRNNPVE